MSYHLNGVMLDTMAYEFAIFHNSDWINNCTCQGGSSGSHPFAFIYGVEARYRISVRVHLVGEVSGMLTARNFDCIGTSANLATT